MANVDFAVREGGASEGGTVTHRLRVRERPQPVIVLLSSSIPQPQVHRLAVNHHVGRIVIKPEMQRQAMAQNEKREPF